MQIQKKNIIDFYKKYQLIITLFVGTLLFFISTFWNPAIYVAAVFILASYAISSIEDIFAYSFYFILFSGVIVFYIVIAVGTFLIVFIKYIVDICKKRVKVYKWPLIATTIIVVIYSLIHYAVNKYSFFQGLLIIAFMYLIYVMFCYRDQIKFRKLFRSLFAGIAVSAVLTLMLYWVDSAKVFVFDNWNYSFISIKDKVLFGSGDETRLVLFSFHTNHLAYICLFLIAYSVHSLINDKMTKLVLIEDILFFVSGLVVGLFTLSKAFLVVLLFEIIYAIICLIIRYKKKSILPIAIFASVVIVLGLIFHNQIIDIINRLIPIGKVNIINEMLTGRLDIWNKFIDELLSSPVKLIFGEGLFTLDVVDIGPHNLYLAILFRFGIVGTLLLIALAIIYAKSCEEKLHFSLTKLLPFLSFLIYSIQETNLDARFVFLTISVMLMFEKNNKEETKQKNEKFIEEPNNNVVK